MATVIEYAVSDLQELHSSWAGLPRMMPATSLIDKSYMSTIAVERGDEAQSRAVEANKRACCNHKPPGAGAKATVLACGATGEDGGGEGGGAFARGKGGGTCRMLSSATEATTQSSEGFHAKSEILLVCPPWMNSSSGGPSSASSAFCIPRQAGAGFRGALEVVRCAGSTTACHWIPQKC